MGHGSAVKMWTISEKPKDYPDKFVVRLFVVFAGGIGATNIFHLADTLEEARGKVPPGSTKFDRSPDDQPQIVESWME